MKVCTICYVNTLLRTTGISYEMILIDCVTFSNAYMYDYNIHMQMGVHFFFVWNRFILHHKAFNIHCFSNTLPFKCVLSSRPSQTTYFSYFMHPSLVAFFTLFYIFSGTIWAHISSVFISAWHAHWHLNFFVPKVHKANQKRIWEKAFRFMN